MSIPGQRRPAAIDLLVGRPYLRPREPGRYEWDQVLLVFRGRRISLITSRGIDFDAEVQSISARFTHRATMLLIVDGVDFEFANLPPSWVVPLTESMKAQALALHDEMAAHYRLVGLPPAESSFANWCRALTQGGASVTGTGAGSEKRWGRATFAVAVLGIVATCALLAYLFLR